MSDGSSSSGGMGLGGATATEEPKLGVGKFRVPAIAFYEQAFEATWEILDQMEIIERHFDTEGATFIARSKWFPYAPEIVEYCVGLDYQNKCIVVVNEYVQKLLSKP